MFDKLHHVRSPRPMQVQKGSNMGPVRLGLYKDEDHAMPAVLLAPKMLTALGWKIGDRFNLLVGKGSDKGRIVVVPEISVGYLLTAGRSTRAAALVRFPFNPVYGLSAVPHKSQSVDYEVKGSELHISCPDWFYAKALNPSELEAELKRVLAVPTALKGFDSLPSVSDMVADVKATLPKVPVSLIERSLVALKDNEAVSVQARIADALEAMVQILKVEVS